MLYLVVIITLSMTHLQNLHDSSLKLLFSRLSYCMKIPLLSLKIARNLLRRQLIACVKWPTNILTQSDEMFPLLECQHPMVLLNCARVIQRLVLSITSGIDWLIDWITFLPIRICHSCCMCRWNIDISQIVVVKRNISVPNLLQKLTLIDNHISLMMHNKSAQHVVYLHWGVNQTLLLQSLAAECMCCVIWQRLVIVCAESLNKCTNLRTHIHTQSVKKCATIHLFITVANGGQFQNSLTVVFFKKFATKLVPTFLATP